MTDMNMNETLNMDDRLLKLKKMVETLYIPNLMNASDGALTAARSQKKEITKEIDSIRKDYFSHAYWKTGEVEKEWICSNCGVCYYGNPPKICRKCNAKMDEKEFGNGNDPFK